MQSSNRGNLETWASALPEREQLIFDMGFATALESVLEDFSEVKTQILSKYLELREEDEYGGDRHREQLLARLKILDLLEGQYRIRMERIKPPLAAIPLPLYSELSSQQ